MIKFIFRYLTFRATHEELNNLTNKHLGVALLGVWIVGIGRYWDNPKAEILQHLGLGSVIYVFVLAGVFWILLSLLKIFVSYKQLLTLISLTSFPAALYAIPVERFMSMEAAAQTNAWFLAVVAIWRVALFGTYLIRTYQIGFWSMLLSLYLPIIGIIFALASLNLEHVVFNIMGGIQDPSVNDMAYSIVFLLAALSYFTFPATALIYIIIIAVIWLKSKD